MHRLEQLVRMLHTPVVLNDGPRFDVAASVGAATPDALGSRDLTQLQRAADAVLYEGKHSGHAVLATAAHATEPSFCTAVAKMSLNRGGGALASRSQSGGRTGSEDSQLCVGS
jgi:GGDEF domain-containing protein